MRAQARLTTISTWLGGNVMIPRWDMRMAIKNQRLQGYRFNTAACFSYSNQLRWAWFQTLRNSINASPRNG
jgi:hypothetical protein